MSVPTVTAGHTPIEHRVGTFRSTGPEATWERVRPMLPRFGITRVAEITDLDEIGIPTTVCYRPDGRTLVVSVGTGVNPAQARVSAVMENIEAWHVEYPVLLPAVRASARDLDLTYDVRALNLAPRSPLTARTVLDWVYGRGLLSGEAVAVPLDTVRLDMARDKTWAEVFFAPSSNGVAAGNTFLDATLHGLLEVIERDCITRYLTVAPEQWRHVDPGEASDPATRTVHDALVRCGCRIETLDITSPLGIPCYSARIWSEDIPMRCGGYGCHIDPGIAVGRALSEAAQSRLVIVSGARDDIDLDVYRSGVEAFASVDADLALPIAAPLHEPMHSLEAAVRHCAERVLDATGVEPFALDLTQPDIGIPVSKVYAPGLALFDFDTFRYRPAHAR